MTYIPPDENIPKDSENIDNTESQAPPDQSTQDTSDQSAQDIPDQYSFLDASILENPKIQALIEKSSSLDTRFKNLVDNLEKSDQDILSRIQGICSTANPDSRIKHSPASQPHYSVPSIISFSVDIARGVQAGTPIVPDHFMAYTLKNRTNILSLKLYQDGERILANIPHTNSQHIRVPFTIPQLILEEGQTTVFRLVGTTTLGKEFSAEYIVTGQNT